MESLETFTRKNDIGVDIEYTIIGYLKEKNNYMIYTDFTTDQSNKLGIKIYVDKEENGKYNRVSEAETKNIVNAFNKEIAEFKGQ